MDAQAAASYFSAARVANSALDALPGSLPADAPLRFGYDVQDAQLRDSSSPLGALVGWKVGATNDAAQAALGFGPFYGPLFDSSVHKDGATLSLSSLGASFKAAEAEFCFVMAADLPAGGPYTEADCWAAVEAVFPAIELAASRLTAAAPSTPAAILADCAWNGAVVLPPPEARVRAADVPGGATALPGAGAALLLDGTQVAASTGANVLGSPLTSLTWLANALREAGHSLRKGQICMTGAAAAHKALPAGSTLEARFTQLSASPEPLGVRVHIVA